MVQADENVVRVCPFGEVDIDAVGQIREQIEKSTASGARRVVLDLHGVSFLDPAGLDLVLDADAASRADGWEFGLIGGPADVQRVFDLTGSRARLPFLTSSELSRLLTPHGRGAAPHPFVPRSAPRLRDR